VRHLDTGDHPRRETIDVRDQQVVTLIRQEPPGRLRLRGPIEQVPGRLHLFDKGGAPNLHDPILAASPCLGAYPAYRARTKMQILFVP
jgi:hypothetical protein